MILLTYQLSKSAQNLNHLRNIYFKLTFIGYNYFMNNFAGIIHLILFNLI
jgi:hypothetical protein